MSPDQIVIEARQNYEKASEIITRVLSESEIFNSERVATKIIGRLLENGMLIERVKLGRSS